MGLNLCVYIAVQDCHPFAVNGHICWTTETTSTVGGACDGALVRVVHPTIVRTPVRPNARSASSRPALNRKYEGTKPSFMSDRPVVCVKDALNSSYAVTCSWNRAQACPRDQSTRPSLGASPRPQSLL